MSGLQTTPPAFSHPLPRHVRREGACRGPGSPGQSPAPTVAAAATSTCGWVQQLRGTAKQVPRKCCRSQRQQPAHRQHKTVECWCRQLLLQMCNFVLQLSHRALQRLLARLTYGAIFRARMAACPSLKSCRLFASISSWTCWRCNGSGSSCIRVIGCCSTGIARLRCC